jgi:alginate O-acetyltransferase complex protein AlgI
MRARSRAIRMLFNSIDFALFLIISLALYHGLRGWPTLQKVGLLACSYWFYGQWNWMYLGLILFSTVLDYRIGLGLTRVRNPRRLIVFSLVVNLGLLAFFKYANFLIANWNGAATLLGMDWQFTALDVLLPVGISFYTFQSLSYTLDVYRGVSPPRQSLLDYALFVAFWPQLVAGPIVRDTEFFSELDRQPRPDWAQIQRGLSLMAFGYLKKVVLADNLAVWVDPVFDGTLANPDAWITLRAIYAFAFQIYFDFSGYTDIAIGAALLMGFRFPQNFDHPYTAQTIQDFWRRWHMTLSRWLRDYLYISLGGNRGSAGRTRINLMLTMLLGGLWHGASWNFVIWGGLHGAYLAVERVLMTRLPGLFQSGRVASLVRTVVSFQLVCVAWVFFRAADFDRAMAIFADLAGDWTAPEESVAYGLLALALLWVIHALSAWGRWLERVSSSRGPVFVLVITGVALAMIWFAPTQSSPFIYFQF